MAMATKNFYGEIDGETIQRLYRFLDSSTRVYSERVKNVNKIYYEDEDCNIMREIWISIFDDNRIKTNLNSSDSIMSETNVCKLIEATGSYLLFSNEAKEIRDEQNEKIMVCDNIKMVKSEARNQSLDNLMDNGETDMSHVLMVEKNEANYKTQIKQVIFSKDFQDKDIGSILLCYKSLLDTINLDISQLRFEIEMEEVGSEGNSRKVNKLLTIRREIEWDMVQVKDQIKKTIYFKAISPTSSGDPYDYINTDEFDYWDKTLIKALSKVHHTETDYAAKYINKFETALSGLIESGVLSDEDSYIIESFRDGVKPVEIAIKVDTSYQNIYKRIETILQTIQRKMIENYELDYYYTEKVKTNWKKCSKCGESYPVNQYYWNKEKKGKDGFQSICKKCNIKRFKS